MTPIGGGRSQNRVDAGWKDASCLAMFIRMYLPGLILLLNAAPADAQVCRGTAPFGSFPYQIGGTAAVADDVRAFGGSFGVGNRYVFAEAGVLSRHFDGAAGSATEIGARGGLEVRVSESRRIFFCPVGFLAFEAGPDAGASETSTLRGGAGGRVGVIVHDGVTLQVVPTFGIDAARRRTSMDVAGIEQNVTDGYGVATIGIGFVASRRFSVTPEVAVPVSAAESDVVVSVRAAYSFGQ